jgi:DNA-binding GntR family transcriptional regulator
MGKSISLPPLTDLGTLPNRVYLILEEAILQGKLKQGDRLIEEELSEMIGVSRAPIREALRSMEKDGLVVIAPRKGTVVNSISREDIAEIYEVASVLEALAVRLFCEKATEEDLEKLKNLYEKMEIQMKNNNLIHYRKLNREFHEILINGSGNKKLIDIYRRLRKQISWFQNITLSSPRNVESWLHEHKDIIDALQRRDPVAAGHIASEHIKRSAKIYLNKENQEG